MAAMSRRRFAESGRGRKRRPFPLRVPRQGHGDRAGRSRACSDTPEFADASGGAGNVLCRTAAPPARKST